MTDRRMDERLRAAGERWRSTVALDTDDRSESLDVLDTRPPNRRRLMTILSAAAVIVLVAVGASVLATHHSTAPAAGKVPAALRGVTWTDHASGSTIVFLHRAARIDVGCESATYAVTRLHSALSVGNRIGMASVCGGGPWSPTRQRDIRQFDTVVMQGPFRWSIDRHVLRLSARGRTLTLTTNGRPTPNIEHQTWRLESVTDERGNVLTHPRRMTLTFDQGAPVGFHGGDGCNTISGDVRSTLTTITFVQPKTSLVGCGSESGETKVIDTLLAHTTDYQIIGNELVLSRAGYAGRIAYRATPTRPAVRPLYGSWRLVRITTPRGWYATHTKPYSDTRLTLRRVANRSGAGLRSEFITRPRCDVVQGRAAYVGHSVRFSLVHVAKALPCPTDKRPPGSAAAKAAAAQASALNRVLRGHAVFDIGGGRLTISRDGVGTLVYTH